LKAWSEYREQKKMKNPREATGSGQLEMPCTHSFAGTYNSFKYPIASDTRKNAEAPCRFCEFRKIIPPARRWCGD